MKKIIITTAVIFFSMAGIADAAPDSNSIIRNGIEYYMQTDKAVYTLGENVEMLYRVTNLGGDDVTFHFDDQVQHYFTVKQNENLIWDVPKVGLPAGSSFTLPPNGFKEYTEIWNMINENGTPFLPDDDFPAIPGNYEITGSLHPVLLSQQDKDRYVPVSVQIEIIPEPAKTYYVDATEGSDDNDGLTPQTAFATIQKAINSAFNGDTVIVADGAYTGPGNRDIDFLGKAITVRSESGPKNCMIDCNGSRDEPHRAFYFHNGEDANSVLEGFTITNCNEWWGGGIYCRDSSPTIINCTITGNRADSGGAIYCLVSSPTITRCKVLNNYADYEAGGIYCEDSNPTITNCLFSLNIAQYAGAIYNNHSDSLIEDCTFLGNSTNNNGSYCFAGAIANNVASSPTIRRCSFLENRSYGNAGAICNDGSSTRPTIHNCIFRKNEASDNGAGMFNYWSSQTTVTNCTFNQNVAHDRGGAIFHGKSETKTTVTNCILRGNSPTETYDDRGMSITYSNVQGGWPGEGNIDANPCFVDPVGGDYHLLSGSPCIDTGDPNYPLDPNGADIDGQPRIIGGRVDMGSDEFHGNNVAPVADAGEDLTVYAWFDGIAEALLDGTYSYDDDGHRLTYLWTWTIDGSSFTAIGPNPTIEIPAGEHIIELIVNDRVEDSEPDEVIVTVVPPIQAAMKLTPQTLNCNSKGNWVKAHFSLPEGFLPEDVDVNEPAVAEPMGIESEYIKVLGAGAGPVRLEICFDREAFCDGLTETGEVEITVIGSLTTSRYFYASDTIRIKPWRQRIIYSYKKNQRNQRPPR